MRSPWLHNDEDEKPQLVSKPGVFDFFSDWSDDILTDLNQLRTAVDQVLGIAPPIDPEVIACPSQFSSQVIPPVNNVESSNTISLPDKMEEINNITDNTSVKTEPGVPSTIPSQVIQNQSESKHLIHPDMKKYNAISSDQVKREINEVGKKPDIKKETIKKELSKEEVCTYSCKDSIDICNKAKKLEKEQELDALLKEAENPIYNPADVFGAYSDEDNSSQTSGKKLHRDENLSAKKKKKEEKKKKRDKKRKTSSDQDKSKDKIRSKEHRKKKPSESDKVSDSSNNAQVIESSIL